MFKIVRSRDTTTTDREVTPSIHHRPSRTGSSDMLVTNMLVTNILIEWRDRKRERMSAGTAAFALKFTP